MDEGRTLIVSDLHLGRPHGSPGDVRALRPLLEGIDVLVVNGDVAEVHHPKWWARAAAAVLSLRDLCDARGVELVLLSGNHDPYLSPLRHLHLAGDRVFVTHGDVLHPAVAPWSPAARRMRDAHEAALADVPRERRDVLEERLRVSEHASFAEWADPDLISSEAGGSTIAGMLRRPWAVGQVLAFWRTFPVLAARFAAEHAPACRFVAVGHSHRPGIHRIVVGGAERIVLNTGSFGFPGHPRAILVHEHELQVRRLECGADGWRPADRPIATWSIPAPTETDGGGERGTGNAAADAVTLDAEDAGPVTRLDPGDQARRASA